MLLYFINSSHTDFQWSGVYICETFIGNETESPGIPSCTDFSNDTRNVHETLKIYETVFIQC